MIQNKQTEPSTASQCLGYPKAYVVRREAKFVYSKKVKIEEKRLLKDVFQLYY